VADAATLLLLASLALTGLDRLGKPGPIEETEVIVCCWFRREDEARAQG